MTSPALFGVSSDDPFLERIAVLSAKIDKADTKMHVLDHYYEGTQPLSFLAPEVEAQVGDRLASMVINWPRVIVDSVQRRCTVEGFRLGAGGAVDAALWGLWNASDMTMWSGMNQVDTLVHGRSFLSVWADDAGQPSISVESAHQVAVEYDPGSFRVAAALKRFQDGDRHRAFLYLPGEVRRYSAPSPVMGVVGVTRWEFEDSLPNPLDVVPIVPLANRPRVLNLDGESELTDVIPLADAVNKIATDMLVTSEFHAGPRRWATGIQIPAGPDRERMQAEVSAYWDNAVKGKTWLAGEGVSFGQFAEANLANFTDAIGMLTGQIAAIAGLPPHYLGVSTQNPASADAIRSAEATLNERAREKHASWGASYKRVMQMALAVRDGRTFAEIAAETATLETVWRDPETRTKAQDADAAVKLHGAGIIDDVQAQESVGLSPMQRQAIADRRETAANTAATADVSARLALARRLETEDGLSKNAALAAVGLLQAAGLNSAEGAA